MEQTVDAGGGRGSALDGKVALITGSARGVGEATARLFAVEGARVAVSDVLDEPGRAVAADLGDAAMYLHLDVTDEDRWAEAVEIVGERFGAIDVLVNNAAVLVMKSIAETTLADFRRVFEVNQAGAFLGVRAVAPVMSAQGRGSIVNVSSVKGMHGLNGLVAYSATKYAMRGISKVAALELGRHGIRVNTVMHAAGNPEMVEPWVATDVDLAQVGQVRERPLARPGRVDETAEAILYLASDRSSYCTGTELVVDGGELAGSIIPGFPGAEAPACDDS